MYEAGKTTSEVLAAIYGVDLPRTTVFGEQGDTKKQAKKRDDERGRVKRKETNAVSPAGPGIEARDDSGAAPTPIPGVGDPQKVFRGVDAFTMDEAKAFCQRARLVINMPLAAGVSGSTAELINVAITLGLTTVDLYALAVLAYIGGGGNHSYEEIVIVLKAAGLDVDPDRYDGVRRLVGEALFDSLKAAHPNAFKDTAVVDAATKKA